VTGNDALRRRLGELVRSRRGPDGPVPRAAKSAETAPPPAPGPVADGPGRGRGRSGRAPAGVPGAGSVCETGVEAFLPGGEWRDGDGAVYVHERLRSDIERPRSHWGRLGDPPAHEPDLAALAAAGLERALFLDLETGGLSSSPVFLAGTMQWNGEDFVLRQYFARHYGEEAALLRALQQAARGFDFLVTFNGKSYDAPFLLNRAFIHGLRLELPPRHLDLLHIARRRWKAELRDCRLQTLEFHVCRRRRVGDVAGEEVPGLYHDFVRSGDPYRLIPVFHHNLLDVITMGEILRALCDGRGPAGPAAGGARRGPGGRD
jgi:uncharacterized protein YprB with RNaseH-like and TPR domain